MKILPQKINNNIFEFIIKPNRRKNFELKFYKIFKVQKFYNPNYS